MTSSRLRVGISTETCLISLCYFFITEPQHKVVSRSAWFFLTRKTYNYYSYAKCTVPNNKPTYKKKFFINCDDDKL